MRPIPFHSLKNDGAAARLNPPHSNDTKGSFLDPMMEKKPHKLDPCYERGETVDEVNG